MAANDIERVKELIVKGQAALGTHSAPPPNVIGFPTCDTQAFTAWQTKSLAYLQASLGKDHPYFLQFKETVKQGYTSDIKAGIGILQSLQEDLEAETVETDKESPEPHVPASSRVFLVHGHNEEILHQTARFLEKLDLEVVILREQPNSGRTIIEKFVDYSDVGFAVVLLTGDDRGGKSDVSFDSQSPRARQNVVMELGFFLGKLGRDRVGALYEAGVEIPSDYSGVLFTQLDSGGAWQFALAKELKAAGLPVDMNRAV